MNDTQQDWFDWAESYLADRKVHDTKWRESFSPQAEQVLEFATQTALSLKHDSVGAEHLLAAVLKLDSGYGAAALKRAGLTLRSLLDEIESERGLSVQKMVAWPILYTPRCKGIIQRARAKIRKLGIARVDVDDLLLELLAERDGLPAKIFCKRSINVTQIKSTIITKAYEQ